MKKCSKCSERKSRKCFNKDCSNSDGLDCWCRNCRKVYRQSESGKVAARKGEKKYRESANGQRVLQCRRNEYYKEHRDRLLAQKAVYRRSLKGRVATARYDHKRRGALEAAESTLTYEEWLGICKHYRFCCAYCGVQFPIERLQMEHVVPLSKGGTHTEDNVVPACGPCNSRKGDRLIGEEVDGVVLSIRAPASSVIGG